MPPFQYESFSNRPYIGTISDLLRAPGEAQARAAEIGGAAKAQALMQTGQGIGGAVQQYFDPAMQDRRALDQAYSGGLDRQSILDKLPGHLKPIVQRQFAEADEAALKVQKLRDETAVAERDYFGSLAAGVKAHDYDPTAAMIALQHAKQIGYGRQADQIWAQMQRDPTQVRSIVDTLIAQSPKQAELMTAGRTADARAAAAARPTDATLAVSAAGGDEQAAAALKLLKPEKDSGAQDDARYERIQQALTLKQPVAPPEIAWAQGYEKRKTLGPEASAAAAADRQAATIAAQTAQQKRAQDFQEQQAGRKELTEKVELPFRQAQQSAQELRDLVQAAQAGNKEAASLQALQATMSTVRANGLNRLNQAEMNLPAHAGSLWDRIKNRAGKLASGQPIDADLQKDLLEYADLIEKGAYNRYKAGHGDVTTRYKLSDEKLQPPPSAPAVGTERTVNGVTRVWGYYNGEWGWKLK